MDVHKDSIDIATADAPRNGEVRHVGSIKGDLGSLDKALRRLLSRGHRLHIVYEAGPCGLVVWRHLSAQGLHCEVVASSSIARPSGDRVNIASSSSSGTRTALRSPERARRASSIASRRSVLRNGIAYVGRANWTAAHVRWLAELKLPHAAQQIAFQE